MFLYLGPVLNGKRAFSYRGAVMWNDLEHELKDEINLNSFKSALTLSCLKGVVIDLIIVY